jgi:XTP/dITP diphosphohydrolase
VHLLVLGTHNRKKGQELAQLLAPFGFALKTLADFPNPREVEETGETFADNSALKAVQQSRHLNAWVLGEDSGLSVDALAGRPGIFSARFAAPDATDEMNNVHLLRELAGVPDNQRSAHYVCHVTLSDPQGVVRASWESTCRGRIRHSPIGTGGFGYDPLFEIVEYHRTFAELGGDIKALLSHRARAMRRMIPQMIAIARDGGWELSTVTTERDGKCREPAS